MVPDDPGHGGPADVPPSSVTAVIRAQRATRAPLFAPPTAGVAAPPARQARVTPPGATPALAALLVPPRDRAEHRPPAAAASPARSRDAQPSPGARSSKLGLLGVAVGVTATLALVAGALGFAWHTRQRAEQNYLAAVAWEREARAAQRSAAEQATEIERLQGQVADLQRQINVLVAERDAATGRADGLQLLLDDANRRLAEAEQRLAELAGTNARAGDQAILGR